MPDDKPAAKRADRGWRAAQVSGPALLLMLVLLVIGGLGGASIGGGFGLAVTLIVLAAMVALLVTWSGTPEQAAETGKSAVSAPTGDD